MSKSLIPAHMQDIDPSKRDELNASGRIQKSPYNPTGVSMHESTGTPQPTEQELSDREIIRARREIMYRSEPLIRQVTDLLRTSDKRVEYVKAIEAAIESVKAS